MASVQQMKDPLLVGKAIRAQLEHEIPQDLPLEKDFREGTDYTITDQCVYAWLQFVGVYSTNITHNASVNELHATLCKDARTLELFTSLVNHLHAFARETRLTHAEWSKTIALLTRAGKESTEFKNEFILLSDCLGFSALVDEINHPKPPVRELPVKLQSKPKGVC
jgi:hypothetical protein